MTKGDDSYMAHMADLSWGEEGCPTVLSIPYEYQSKSDKKNFNGSWTIPKKGTIRWKN